MLRDGGHTTVFKDQADGTEDQRAGMSGNLEFFLSYFRIQV